MHRKRDHKMCLELRPVVMWPMRLLPALRARQCSAELRMEDLGKEELGLINKNSIKANLAHAETQSSPDIFLAVLATGGLSQRQGKKRAPLSLPLGNLMAESTVIKAGTVGVLSSLLRSVGAGDTCAYRRDVCPCLVCSCMQVMRTGNARLFSSGAWLLFHPMLFPAVYHCLLCGVLPLHV